jgi:RHS repeat-associated protein
VQVSGAATANFVYDGDGKRMLAIEGGTTTVFIGNYFEWSGTPASAVRYDYAGTTRLAMRRGSGSVIWLLGDHLGSASVSYAGTNALHQGYKPWGETRFGEVGMPYQFTGQYRQASLGLDFFNARWYDPALGRFAQADTLIPEASQGTQAWDRYAYALNNPLRFIDPTGKFACGDGINDPRCDRIEPGNDAHPDDDGPLTEKGRDTYNDYVRLKWAKGWWNNYTPGNLTPEQFLGLMILWERSGLDIEALLIEATANQLWMDTSAHGGHVPYCQGTACGNGLFNFLGAYADPYHKGGHISNRVAQMLNGLFQESNLLAGSETMSNIMNRAESIGDFISTSDPSRNQYNGDVPYHWGNRSGLWDRLQKAQFGFAMNQVVYWDQGNFIIYTLNQAIFWGWQ